MDKREAIFVGDQRFVLDLKFNAKDEAAAITSAGETCLIILHTT
jgi:hypothetical protein